MSWHKPVGQATFCGFAWDEFQQRLRVGSIRVTKCAVDGCGRVPCSRGLCHAHYQRLVKGVDLLSDIGTRWQVKGRVCCVDGCEDRVRCKGMCHKHYQRYRKTGSVDTVNETQPQSEWWQWAKSENGRIRNKLRILEKSEWESWAKNKKSMIVKRHEPSRGWVQRNPRDTWRKWASLEKDSLFARERRSNESEWDKWARGKKDRIYFRTRPVRSSDRAAKGNIKSVTEAHRPTRVQMFFDWSGTEAEHGNN